VFTTVSFMAVQFDPIQKHCVNFCSAPIVEVQFSFVDFSSARVTGNSNVQVDRQIAAVALYIF
jgi:hypothetical protein